jgi:hypothetical protein
VAGGGDDGGRVTLPADAHLAKRNTTTSKRGRTLNRLDGESGRVPAMTGR